MTGLDLISGSLRLLGVLAGSEQPSAAEANAALQSLNDMLDSWSNERLLISSIVREVFALTGSQATYTMGTGGNFNSSRPMLIENALIQLPGSNPVVEMPVKVLNKDEYAAILIKTVTSTFPIYLFNDDNYPLANINVYPVPSATCNLVLYSSKPFTQVATLLTALSLPLGYQRALKYNLAVDLATEFGRTVSPEIAAVAEASRAAIKRMNSKPRYARVDNAISARPSAWNVFTGEPI